MMDDTRVETLSRYLDNDLPAEEAEALEARLRSEPALAAELEALRSVRRSIAAIAASEEPPTELDQVVDPLLRGRPPNVVLRPWARWLATAAVIVLGITVIFEVNRNRLGGMKESSRVEAVSPSARPDGERFALAPLPTSSVPEEEQVVGVADRILAQSTPEVKLDDPPALEVIGPLANERTTQQTAPPPEEAEEHPASTSREADGAGGNFNEAPAMTTATQARGLDVRKSEQKEARPAESPVADGRTDRTLAPWTRTGPSIRGQLFIFMDGETAWQDFEPKSRCQSGRYSVRIRVSNSVVSEVWPVGRPPVAASERLCAAELIVDLNVEGVPDGEFSAEVVVERSAPER